MITASGRVRHTVYHSIILDTDYTATAADGPMYAEWILFLKRVSSREYFRASSWATACRPGDRMDVFYDPGALARLSLASLRTLAQEVKGEERIVLIVSHAGVFFPHRSWSGVTSSAVRLPH